MNLKTDVFLTHDWGVNQANHHRVAEINAALIKKGIITWFDEVCVYFCTYSIIQYECISDHANSKVAKLNPPFTFLSYNVECIDNANDSTIFQEKMEGNVREKMLEGINNCKCVVVFITERRVLPPISDLT
jgi:hypothetical protein